MVAGGARGIGRAVAARLLEAGASVVVADVDEPAARAAARELEGRGRCLPAGLDVCDASAVRALVESTVAELGRLDVWVSSAGIYPCHDVLAMAEEDWDRVIGVNLRGTFVGAREAARAMADTGRGGVIVNIASTASFRAAGRGVSHYTASKFGVRGLTMSLAAELGPYGVRVLAIAPTVTLTPGLEEARPAFEAAGIEVAGLAERLPLGRLGVPDDVARAAVFCASDLSLFMTGSTLLVDGGEMTI